MKKSAILISIKHQFEYLVVLFFIFFLKNLSAKSIFLLGRILGNLSYSLTTKRRKIALVNLNIAFGNKKSNKEKKKIIKNSFIQVALSTLQSLWVLKNPNRVKQLIEGDPVGLDIVEKCLLRQKGIFFLTAHYGNWEIMGIDHGYRGICKLHSIIRRLDNPYLDEVAFKLRTISGNGIFYRNESLLQIVRVLKNNEAVAIMMDQNTAKGGIFVDFFGEKAATARALARLSYRTGTPIIPFFCYPTEKGTYRLKYGPELTLKKTEHREKDITEWTQLCEKFIEKTINDTPDPWIWAHRRWKTRPPEEKGRKVY
ncbi:MAG: lysophospholipid acyltransferase family protein [Nitrospina sp.]|jgi:Kdo2-lipid IVA lauroyltransferase/acyltransferase|nr:lysophospholipid acyltransferase family protein [Nitrospina sp.]MBT6600056.1 lysophospholipid acyltransferase family protein [Nitrospina sp.]